MRRVSRRWLANPWGQRQRVAEGAVFPRNQYQCRLASLLAVLSRRSLSPPTRNPADTGCHATNFSSCRHRAPPPPPLIGFCRRVVVVTASVHPFPLFSPNSGGSFSRGVERWVDLYANISVLENYISLVKIQNSLLLYAIVQRNDISLAARVRVHVYNTVWRRRFNALTQSINTQDTKQELQK